MPDFNSHKRLPSVIYALGNEKASVIEQRIGSRFFVCLLNH